MLSIRKAGNLANILLYELNVTLENYKGLLNYRKDTVALDSKGIVRALHRLVVKSLKGDSSNTVPNIKLLFHFSHPTSTKRKSADIPHYSESSSG